jgi:dihydroxyacetone kinase-like protein
MFDALAPALEALESGGDLAAAAAAAEKGRDGTKSMVARKGRASYLGQRSVGHIDPGAASAALLMAAAATVVGT